MSIPVKANFEEGDPDIDQLTHKVFLPMVAAQTTSNNNNKADLETVRELMSSDIGETVETTEQGLSTKTKIINANELSPAQIEQLGIDTNADDTVQAAGSGTYTPLNCSPGEGITVQVNVIGPGYFRHAVTIYNFTYAETRTEYPPVPLNSGLNVIFAVMDLADLDESIVGYNWFSNPPSTTGSVLFLSCGPF